MSMHDREGDDRGPEGLEPDDRADDRPDDDRPDDDWDELDLGGDLGDQLRALLDPDRGLSERMHTDVDRTLRGRSVLATGLDLIGLGFWTARELLTDPVPSADEDPEGI